MTELYHLSLFSGMAGFDLGLMLAGVKFRTVGYVEIDSYCQKLIQQRIEDGILDYAPIIRDIKAADFRPMAGLVDIITGGFPCQPHSVAGKRRGADDERNLWPDTLRCIREVGPRWVLLENVPGILANGHGGTVVGQLSEIGYDCQWHCVPAAAVGAPHLRWRWWCLATNARRSTVYQQYRRSCGESGKGMAKFAWNGQDGPVADAERMRELQPQGIERNQWRRASHCGQTVGNATGGRCQEQRKPEPTGTPRPGVECPGWWAVEPDVGRVANGVPARVDRLRTLGNGIVPAVVPKFLGGVNPM